MTAMWETGRNPSELLRWEFGSKYDDSGVRNTHFALRYNEAAKRFYERKRARTNGAVATKALAHKLARACYHMLKGQIIFDEKRCFA